MDAMGAEVGQKMRSAIKAKLMELGCYVDDELPDYIMVMVANKRSRSQMIDDLQLFLRSDTDIFVEWLQQVLKKLKEVTITNPEVCSTFRELKRKAAMEIADCVIKKEKRDKKIKSEKKTKNIDTVEVKSITDEIPVQATKLLEKRNQKIAEEVVNEDNFDIPSLAEVNELEDSQLEIMENKIKEARSRIVLMKSDSEDDDFINIRADAEELMGNELDKNNLTNIEPAVKTSEEIQKVIIKRPISERLGARPVHNVSSIGEKRKITVSDSKEKEKQSTSRVKSIVKKTENKTRKKESVHKRLGLYSSVVSLNKKDTNESDEEVPKSVKSSVKVKPRRNIPGLVQANKNLLLKAVAEAQKSVTQTPIVGREIKKKKPISNDKKVTNNNISTKSTAVEDEKLQNIIIEVKGIKNGPELEDSVEEERYSPEYESAEELDITCEDDLDKYEEDLENNESGNEEVKNHQFIVTLDGLKDKNIIKSSENDEKPIKKAPSPIIFDKNVPEKVEKPQIPEKLPRVHLPLALKTKERCKYWPNCRLRDACEFVHPTVPCNVFPLCKFGDKCLYIHPKCKFDASCTRKDCPYSHGNVKTPAPKVVRPLASFVVTPEICKFHPNCSNPHCHFYHPTKPCKFGKYCMNKSECNFSHGKIPNKDKLTWHSNVR